MHVSVIILSQKRDSHTLTIQTGLFGNLRLPENEKKGSVMVCLVAYLDTHIYFYMIFMGYS